MGGTTNTQSPAPGTLPSGGNSYSVTDYKPMAPTGSQPASGKLSQSNLSYGMPNQSQNPTANPLSNIQNFQMPSGAQSSNPFNIAQNFQLPPQAQQAVSRFVQQHAGGFKKGGAVKRKDQDTIAQALRIVAKALEESSGSSKGRKPGTRGGR